MPWNTLLFLSAAILSASAAHADENQFAGRWQQVYSSAGFCKSCLIAVVQHGTVLMLTANTGWSAILQTELPGHSSFATGSGSKRKGNQPLDIGLALSGEDLHLLMLVKAKDGTTSSIKAIYRKPSEENPTTRS
ncbi:hypothetical protein LJR235_001985 [Pararhizobium sp. LjRoot235]|uniref:hypothetical protein n=1 Tax=Pararhizobium sp. LjRoot235 TaxID=3342291 RepID=UPI003ECD169E